MPEDDTAPEPPTADGAGPSRAPSVGLILGAGGVAGYAFHTGVLAALADHAGWDARSAELIVGTSAGAGIASLLRAGLAPLDHYAHSLGRRLSPEADAFFARLPTAAWDSGAVHDGRPLPASAGLVARGLLQWPPRPGLVVAGSLPRGRRDPAPMGERHRVLHPQWPTASLWICALRMGDGRRVVFGRDDHPPLDVGTAVEASSAVPGLFRPVRVGGRDHLDGGVWSATNTDLVAGLGFDTVVVVAPLSTPHRVAEVPRRLGAARRDPGEAGRTLSRAYHRSVLEAEVRRVRRSGTPVIVIEPTVDDLAVVHGPAPAGGRRADIAEVAYASVAERLHREPATVARLGERLPA